MSTIKLKGEAGSTLNLIVTDEGTGVSKEHVIHNKIVLEETEGRYHLRGGNNNSGEILLLYSDGSSSSHESSASFFRISVSSDGDNPQEIKATERAFSRSPSAVGGVSLVGVAVISGYRRSGGKTVHYFDITPNIPLGPLVAIRGSWQGYLSLQFPEESAEVEYNGIKNKIAFSALSRYYLYPLNGSATVNADNYVFVSETARTEYSATPVRIESLSLQPFGNTWGGTVRFTPRIAKRPEDAIKLVLEVEIPKDKFMLSSELPAGLL